MTVKPEDMLKWLTQLSQRENADVYVFSAGIQQGAVDKFRKLVFSRDDRKENAVLFLTTRGGYPDPAYQLAACLQSSYKSTAVYIFGVCKSAGTLVALGANSIVMGDFGELGPLDVQLTKPDEIMSSGSGLDIFQAVGIITESAFEAFERYLLSIITKSGGNISSKTAAEIATELAVGLFSPMTAQIDPERLGEVQRAINIANAYGAKLDKGNLKKDALDKLVQGYPTHGFVIDLTEANTIFHKVRAADQLERNIGGNLVWALRPDNEQPFVADLVKLFTLPGSVKGPSNAVKPRAKRTSKATSSARRAVNAQNVSQFKGDVTGDSTSAKTDSNTQNGQPLLPPKTTRRLRGV